jgi:hypothetical protein
MTAVSPGPTSNEPVECLVVVITVVKALFADVEVDQSNPSVCDQLVEASILTLAVKISKISENSN